MIKVIKWKHIRHLCGTLYIVLNTVVQTWGGGCHSNLPTFHRWDLLKILQIFASLVPISSYKSFSSLFTPKAKIKTLLAPSWVWLHPLLDLKLSANIPLSSHNALLPGAEFGVIFLSEQRIYYNKNSVQ